jgi:hypothetical protein
MKQASIFNTALKFVLVVLTAMQVACSSSSSDSGASDATISGTIVAAPVNGADVSVVDAAGNEVVPAVKTDANGKYSLVIPQGSLGQDLIVKSSGGSFTDEATANPGTAGAMYAYTPAGSLSNGSSVSATPGSTIIAELVMTHGKARAEAEAAFAAAFSYTPDVSVNPADATTAPAADETDAETLAGFRAGAFSQLAMDLGLSQDDQFALFAALAQDLSDDKLDGVDASGAVAIGTTGKTLEADIQNRFATALINFHDSANNLTGLDNAQIGNLPFGKVALTDTFRIEYVQIGMMDPMEGKSTFQLHITDRVSGADVTGNVPGLSVMMHMATHEHSTPMPTPAVSEDVSGGGMYTVTLYYLMPSQMMDDLSMGYWDLKFTVSGEVAHFYPAVMMAMGDTAQVRLKGVDDKIMSMTTGDMVSRTYFMFNDSLTCTMVSCDFSVFVASQQNMMSFPAVFVNGFLSGKELTDVRVEISDDDGANWYQADDDGNGIWTRTGLSLTDGMEDEIRIRLWVELDSGVGEYKTTDGMVQNPGVNDYQTFKVTPGGM